MSTEEWKSFDSVPEPKTPFHGFTVTVEYDSSPEKVDVVKRFYGAIINGRPDFTYYKTMNISPGNKSPTVLVRCDGNIVYRSSGRVPWDWVWDEAIDWFLNKLDEKKEECRN